MKKTRLRIITEKAASDFLKNAAPREMLSSDTLPGFHLLKLAKGASWRYRYTDHTGRRRVVTIGGFPALKPDTAAQKVREWLADGQADPLREKEQRRKKAVTEEEERQYKALGYYLNGRYSKVMDSWPPRSATLNKQRIEKNFANLLDLPMDEITHRHIEQWQEAEQKRGIAHSTVQRVLTSLKALLRQAVQHKVIAADPLQGFSPSDPSFEEQKRIRQRRDALEEKRCMLTDAEIQALHHGLDAFTEDIRQQRRNSRKHGKPHLPCFDTITFPHWFVPFCLLALHTGLRPGDLYTLTWRELNINFAVLKKITSKSARSVRKGKGGTLVEIRLNDTIRATMADWWKQHGKPSDGLVFPSPVNSRQLALTAHHRPWNTVKELGGLPESLNFYALRHHFISALVAQGLPLLAVAALAGHRTTLMIEKHYGHLCDHQAAQAVDVLAGNISRAVAQQGVR